MSPEQADDPHGADSRTDLYALGCTLYELLAGQPPYAGAAQRTVLQKLKAHASAPIPSLCERRRDIPKSLATVVEKLLAKNPSERTASAGELAEALAPFTAGADLRKLLEQAEHAPAPAAQSPVRQLTSGAVPNSTGTQVPKRRHVLWVGALMGAAVAVFAGVVLYLQTDQGVIQIDAKDDDVKISVEQGGKVIEIMDLQKKKTYRLASGGYELKIVAGKEDFEIKPQSLTLKRGKTEIVRISCLDKQPFVKVQWPELDKAWLERAARLSPEEKADEIIKELVRRNPGFEGKGVKVQSEEGKLSLIFTQGGKLLDLMPLRGAAELTSLGIINGDTADLSPLQSLSLNGLDLMNTKVSDLTPLKRMSLKYLNLNGSSKINDLTPLNGQPIDLLDVSGTSVSDLTPLALLPELSVFSCAGAKVTDLGPLRHVKKLSVLNCSDQNVSDLEPLQQLTLLYHLELTNTKVKDLRPLANLPLKYLNIRNTLVTDLAPLRELPIEKLVCDFDAARDGAVLRSLKKLAEINGKAKSELLP